MAKNSRNAKRGQATSGADAPPVWREMSAAQLEKMRQKTEQQIDEFMKRVGYANPSERTDDQGWRWFDYGSAKGRAGIVESDSDGEMFLRAESLVMKLPSDENEMLPLMRELLEANMTIAGSARLGISGEGVFVSATIPVVELAAGDVPAHIHSVMAIAESFGHPFAEEVKQEGAGQGPAPLETVVEPQSAGRIG